MGAAAIGWGVAWRWAALYTALSIGTQLWAGTQFSNGQGGGLGELIMWSAVFGLIAVGVAVERALNGSRIVDPGAAFVAAVIGQVAATGIAVWWFTAKGGPRGGDWWIGPALAVLAVALWLHLLAPRRRVQDEHD